MSDSVNVMGSDSVNCEICGGLGWISADVPVGHPKFGKLIPCPHRQGEVNQSEIQKQLQELGPLRNMTLLNFEPEGHVVTSEQRISLRNAIEGAKRFIAEPRGWLLLQGGYGCGKTHLAAAIANAALEKGIYVTFANVPDLLDYLRAAYSPTVDETYDQRFSQVRDAQLLILDDLGTQNTTPWAEEKLYQILNARYVAKRPTVITTNLDLDDIDPRIQSRLSDIDLVRKLKITAPDYRRSAVVEEQTSLSVLAHYSDKTFDTFRLRSGNLSRDQEDNLEDALRIAKDFADDPRDWLIFTGGHGVGKTHLAAAIANYRVRRGYPVVFVVVPDLLDYFRASFSPDARSPLYQRFEEVRNTPLLMLDDFGTEATTPWAKEKLFQIINYRYVARLPTVVTTSSRVTEIDERIQIRFVDETRCMVFPITATNYRGGTVIKTSPASTKTYTSRRRSSG